MTKRGCGTCSGPAPGAACPAAPGRGALPEPQAPALRRSCLLALVPCRCFQLSWSCQCLGVQRWVPPPLLVDIFWPRAAHGASLSPEPAVPTAPKLLPKLRRQCNMQYGCNSHPPGLALLQPPMLLCPCPHAHVHVHDHGCVWVCLCTGVSMPGSRPSH